MKNKNAYHLLLTLIILAVFATMLMFIAEIRQSREVMPGITAQISTNSINQATIQEINVEDSPCENVIDFETNAIGQAFTIGDYVQDQYVGFGVQITTSDPTNHPLLIFDSRNPTGNWKNLDVPDKETSGNLLIVSKAGNQENPSVLGAGGTFTFTFSLPTTIMSFDAIDIDTNESGGTARLYDKDQNEIASFPLLTAGDNTVQTVEVDVKNIHQMAISFVGSGAIDNIKFCPLPGNCNGSDDNIAIDKAYIKTEIFDGDNMDRRASDYFGRAACDTNANGLVEAGDITCLDLHDENRQCNSKINTHTSSIILSDVVLQPSDHVIVVPIRLIDHSESEIESMTISLKFDTEVLQAYDDDKTPQLVDNDGTGSPDEKSSPCQWIGNDTRRSELLDEGIINLFISLSDISTVNTPICSLVFKVVTVPLTTDLLETTVEFSETVPPTCGSDEGGYVPCEGVGSLITINKFPTIYLPFIINQSSSFGG